MFTVYNNMTTTKFACMSTVLPHIISGPKLRGINVHVSATLLLVVGNWEVRILGSLHQLYNIHTKFQKNRSAGPAIGMGTDQRTYTCMHTQRQIARWYSKSTFSIFRRESMLRNKLTVHEKFPTHRKFNGEWQSILNIPDSIPWKSPWWRVGTW